MLMKCILEKILMLLNTVIDLDLHILQLIVHQLNITTTIISFSSNTVFQ